MTVRLHVGDVRQRIAEIPDSSVDLVCCSPPFLALRKYGDNDAEMGSEGTPADFLDALLELTQEFRRVLAPHGSIAIELGDTYSGSGGAGGDYNVDGWRENQPAFVGSGLKNRGKKRAELGIEPPDRRATGNGWPLAKSLCLIPTLYPASLAYGHNLLREPPSTEAMLAYARDWVETPHPDKNGPGLIRLLEMWQREAERAHKTFTPWRVRNVIVWARPNPPVGALGDKVRPATSYITVACTGAKRWFDLDAVRTEHAEHSMRYPREQEHYANKGGRMGGAGGESTNAPLNPAGAPPLDWWEDDVDPDDPTDHLTIVMPTQPYPGAHYATWPAKLARRLVEMMCPQRVCTTCGAPSERITERTPEYAAARATIGDFNQRGKGEGTSGSRSVLVKATGRDITSAENITVGWSDCGHNTWRPGVVLDPFAGSGTTLAVASGLGRDAIGIELYEASAALAGDRVGGLFMEYDPPWHEWKHTPTVELILPSLPEPDEESEEPTDDLNDLDDIDPWEDADDEEPTPITYVKVTCSCGWHLRADRDEPDLAHKIIKSHHAHTGRTADQADRNAADLILSTIDQFLEAAT